MTVKITSNANDTINELAEYFVEAAKYSIALHNRFSVVLSGGSSPKKLYEVLASPPFKNKIEWEKVDFFLGDERYVPHTHPDSNYLMAKKALFEPLNIDTANIYPIDTSLLPENAAAQYTTVIKNYFTQPFIHFDLILLGLGDDAHTASLFPNTSVLKDTESAVRAVFLEDKQVYRITMNAPLINQAHRIAFLVYGASKAEALYHVLEDESNKEQYPAQLINDENKEVYWFTDVEAAQMLAT